MVQNSVLTCIFKWQCSAVHHEFLRCGVDVVFRGAPEECHLLNVLFKTGTVDIF